VSGRQIDCDCELTVADNGIGIDPNNAERVFEIRMPCKGLFTSLVEP
jgi:signal transduction histidine kinase